MIGSKKTKVFENRNTGVIPKPAKCDESVYGEFIIYSHTNVYSDVELIDVKDYFVEMIKDAGGFTIPTVLSKSASVLFLFDNHIPTEGYKINCTSEKLTVYASTYAGGLYAVQTLRQLLQTDKYEKMDTMSLHATNIEDSPVCKWRSVMLDECRWFFGKESVKRLLDMMVRYKLNTLHWHLSDNEGWRVEIKKYPKLTEIGSRRAGTQNMSWGKWKTIDWTPHQGFYTQDDIREIVEYAALRNITIIPEIDMPAHFNAAIAAYPYLSCKEEKIDVAVSHGGPKSTAKIIACAGKESTYKFIYDIIDELSDLFPAPYFHIGGDEAPKSEWKLCPNCQKVIKENGLADEEELQAYFNNRIALYLKSKGKRLIGWNEILKGKNLDKSAIVQYWTNTRDKNVEEYAKSGGNVIMSKHQAFYFDMPYAMNNLQTTYDFDSQTYGINADSGAVIGEEGTLWAEWVFSQERLDFQLFPRILALAENAWTSPKFRNYADFEKRLNAYLPSLERLGINYAPAKVWNQKGIIGSLLVSGFFASDAHCEYRRGLKFKKKVKA